MPQDAFGSLGKQEKLLAFSVLINRCWQEVARLAKQPTNNVGNVWFILYVGGQGRPTNANLCKNCHFDECRFSSAHGKELIEHLKKVLLWKDCMLQEVRQEKGQCFDWMFGLAWSCREGVVRG